MAVQSIEKLDELLKDVLGPNKTIINHEINKLTMVGENYGSLMVAVTVKVQNGDQIETIEAVAKLPHPGEYVQKLYNMPVTFHHEIHFYKTVLPVLRSFLREKGISEDSLDCFPKFLGARVSLKNPDGDVADTGAVLLLENLKALGYEVGDRELGFDLKTAKIILKDLANLQAVFLAFKLLKPEEFNNKFKHLFTSFQTMGIDKNILQMLVEGNMQIVEALDDCRQFSKRLRANFEGSLLGEIKNSPIFIREPFATIVHTDLWVHNVMVKFTDGEPVNASIFDFQMYEYGSPARDVMFFVYTSVQTPVLENHYDELIQTYHGTFIETLEKLGCNTEPFSMEKFQEEIQISMKQIEVLHSMGMLKAMYATKEDLEELTTGDFTEEEMAKFKDMSISKKHKDKVEFMVKDFAKRNFI